MFEKNKFKRIKSLSARGTDQVFLYAKGEASWIVKSRLEKNEDCSKGYGKKTARIFTAKKSSKSHVKTIYNNYLIGK